MTREYDDTPEGLQFAFLWSLLGLVVLTLTWAGFHSHTLSRVDIRSHERGEDVPPFNTVEIVRRDQAPLRLTARQDLPSDEAARWPVPETVPLRRVEALRLIDTRKHLVVDEVAVSDTSLSTKRFGYELGTGLSMFAALDYLFSGLLVAMFVAGGILFLLFVLIGWTLTSKDSWWFMRWWMPSGQ